ncbi:unnamed protein product [Dicrocoelium dendriticum]|nr:unnamed protein product [Dicrocoelium dendriticum]
MEDELQQLPLFDTIHSAANRDSSSPASFSLKADYNSFVTQNNLGVKWDVGECPSETNLRILDGCCEFHRNSAPTSSETVLKRRWDDGEVIPGDSLKDATSNFPQHFCVENKNLSRNCSPLERNSFLSYATEDGSSVKVRSSRFQLLPLTSLGRLLNELLKQYSPKLEPYVSDCIGV